MSFHTDFSKTCLDALQVATGKIVMPVAKKKKETGCGPPLLVRVGILGPAIAGQCVIELSLLSALNLTAFSAFGKNFTSINDEDPQNEMFRKIILGIPGAGNVEHFKCNDTWVRTIEVKLGQLSKYDKMVIGINKPNQQYRHGTIRVKLGSDAEHYTVYKLDSEKKAIVDLKDRKANITILSEDSLSIEYDETDRVIYDFDENQAEDRIITKIDGKKRVIKTTSLIVKSSVLELSNQVSPQVIPQILTGDISTPSIIPARARIIPISNLEEYNAHYIISGVGNLTINAQLRDVEGLRYKELDAVKRLFDYQFAHPVLKKLFG